MKVLFIRTPRYVWPFNSETSAFWQPLGFMSLAGQLEAACPNISVKIIDCATSKIGWKSLFSILNSDWPDVICLGEETVSSHEAMRLAGYVKEQHKETIVIAGGVFFSNAAEQSLKANCIDYIVHGEGEITLQELLTTLANGADLKNIKGISYKQDGQVIRTADRPPISDMDTLPIPAWSKVPMHLYGLGAKNHPGLVSIEHSRGCTDNCSFCTLWKHMGKPSTNGSTIKPYFRTKSAERSLEEVTRLIRDFDRFTFGWVDPTWNVDPKWTDEFCGLLLKHNIRIRQTAWLRADYVVRDEELGILEKAVRAGLCQVMIGVERTDEPGLQELNKHSNGPNVTAKAFEIFRTKYPGVLTIGSVIFGLWDETEKSLEELSRYQYKIGMDYCFFIPLTPNPGTDVYDDACKRGIIEVGDRRCYNFHTPVMRTRRFSAKQLERLYFKLLFGASFNRMASDLRQFFTVRDKRRKSVLRSLLKYGMKISARHTATRLLRPFSNKPTTYSRKPKWYNS
ncbi:MAG: B12-binding domain-containing radical SAM protein [Planctomycetota bacterium]|jgi:anaerobic magnesium-protoporphyrin IX monomethyl ester cyclase